MKNRKRILSFGMAVLMAVSLCACGGGKGGDRTGSAAGRK